MDLVKLNNEISSTRPAARQAKVHVIHWLTRKAAELERKKGTEIQVAKNKKKAERLKEEALIDKILTADEITKFSLQFDSSLRDKVLDDINIPLPTKALARLASHPAMLEKVGNFREKCPDWNKWLEKSLEKLGTGSRFGQKMKNGRVKAHMVQRQRVQEAVDTIKRSQMAWLHKSGSTKVKVKTEDVSGNSDGDEAESKETLAKVLVSKKDNQKVKREKSDSEQTKNKNKSVCYEEADEEESEEESYNYKEIKEEAGRNESDAEDNEADVHIKEESEESEEKSEENEEENEENEEESEESEEESEENEEESEENEEESDKSEVEDIKSKNKIKREKTAQDKEVVSRDKTSENKTKKSQNIEENKKGKLRQEAGKGISPLDGKKLKINRKSESSDSESLDDESETADDKKDTYKKSKQNKADKKCPARSREAEVCRFADLIKKEAQTRHSDNSEESDSAQSEDGSHSPKAEDKGVDPFFVTRNNDFLRLATAKREEKPPEPVRQGPKWGVEGCENWTGTRRERRARAFGRAVPKRFSKREGPANFYPASASNHERNVQNVDVPPGNVSSIPPGEPEKLHPSWEAKRKMQASLTPFQGKKVKFDDSD